MISPPAASSQGDDELLVIDADQPTRWFDLREIWRHRELVWILAARDIKVRYRQAAVGLAWVVLQPVAETLVFTGLFSLLGKRPATGEAPYGASLFCGLVLWQLFASIVTASTTCLVDNRQLLTKVYFPRVVLPLSAALRPLVDFGVACTVLALLLAWHWIAPTVAWVVAPVVVAVTVLTALSLGLWLSALNAHYRDFGYIVPFLLRIGFFISPVIYETASLIPPQWRPVYGLNPMASLLDAFRWSLLGTEAPSLLSLTISTVALLVVLWTGAWYFRRVERFLSDRI